MGKKRKDTTAAAVAVAAAQPATAPVAQGGQQVRVPSHQHTDAAPTGLGQKLSAAPGRLAREPLPHLSSSQPAAKWSPPAAAPSSCPQAATAAVELELARAAALDALRHKFASLTAKAGLRNTPLLAFERWRFAAKWAEDEPTLAAAAAAATAAVSPQQGGNGNSTSAAKASTQVSDSNQQQQQQQGNAKQKKQKQQKHKQQQQQCDPVMPFGALPAAPEPGLVSDLTRAGLDAAAAVDVATQLAGAAAAAAGGLVKKRQQLASGKAASCGSVQVEFHNHSLDLTCGGSKVFVKVSRPAYGKLARLYREHWINRVTPAAAAAEDTAPAAACSVGLPPAEAAARLASMQAHLGPPAAAAAAAAGGNPRVKRQKTAHDSSSSSGEGSDDDDDSGDDQASSDDDQGLNAAAGAAAAAGRSGAESLKQQKASGNSGSSDLPEQGFLLDVEARLAELEQTQTAATQTAATGGSSSGHTAGAEAAGSSSSSAREQFHSRLFALLLRYKSIQGHGFQAAAGPSVFDLLRQQLAVGFECFASPLNAHFSRFGSAFPDVDAPFGSGGSFFRMSVKYGSYEVNPPFVPSILTAAAQHMLQLLETAEAAGSALGFVVLMPGWREVTGWQLINSSSFLKHSLLLAAADHGYCDGASHQRKDLFRQSPFDSSIMFLQTTAAAKKWPVTPRLRQDLQAAFAACCPSAAAVERQRKQRGARDLDAKGHGVPVQKLPAGAVMQPTIAAATAAATAAAKHGKKKKKRKQQAEGKPQSHV